MIVYDDIFYQCKIKYEWSLEDNEPKEISREICYLGILDVSEEEKVDIVKILDKYKD